MATRLIKRGTGSAYARLVRWSHKQHVHKPQTIIERRIKHWKEVSAIFGGVREQVAPAILEELQSIMAEMRQQ